MPRDDWDDLNGQIEACTRCPRLVEHCRQIGVVKRRAYRDCDYWSRPVPNMGSLPARLMIVGLAPGAHGANRTGRMFTGDRSGDWLFRALHNNGFANQAESSHRGDGLSLIDCVITAACHCAPPDNRPTAEETAHCAEWYERTVELARPRVWVALGQVAWRAITRHAVARGWAEAPLTRFGHGVEQALTDDRLMLASYHPSQQNTFTGRLTERMLDDVFQQAAGRLR